MARRRHVDEASSRGNERRNPVDQGKVAQVIRSELRFEAIGGVAERCGHDAGVGDDHVEGLTFFQELIGAGTHALQVAEIELNQFEASATGVGIPSDLRSRCFGLGQIARRTHDVSTVRGKGTRSLDAKSGGNAGHQDALPAQIHSG